MISANLVELQSTYGSVDFSRWQDFRWQFYDWPRYLPAGVTSQSFFTVGVGGTDPVSAVAKTLEDTNLTAANQFGQVFMVIQEIRCHALILPKPRQPAGISDDADTLWTLMSNMMSKYLELLRRGVLKWQIQNKDFLVIDQPFLSCPPGFGVRIQQHAASYISGFTNFAIWVQQSPRHCDLYDVNPPQVIEPNQTFSLTIDYPDGTSPVFTELVNSTSPKVALGVIFDGYIVRPMS